MRKRSYILFVTRDEGGQLRKIPIPVHYMSVLALGAAIGLLTGVTSSYTRMLLQVSRYNQLRTEKEELKHRYSQLEQAVKETDIQVASLGSLASEVSALYGLKAEPILVTPDATNFQDAQVSSSLGQLYALKNSALSGAATVGIALGLNRNMTTADWMRANAAPNLWPVEGTVTGSFGERIDPFNGEGAFHSGVDLSTSFGTPVIAPADGVVVFANLLGGYGRAIVIDHGNGISTRYGHFANFAVISGQHVRRGDIIGYVGLSGRSTGPHLHYEVRINDTPVNPHKYLRVILSHDGDALVGARPESQLGASHPRQIAPISSQNTGVEPTSNKTGLPRITGIRHWSSPGSSTVVVDLPDHVQWEAHRLTGPPRIYFDLHDTALVPGLPDKAIEIGDALVARVRVARYTDRITRVVLETIGLSTYSVSLEQNPYRLVVEVRKSRAERHPNTTSSLPNSVKEVSFFGRYLRWDANWFGDTRFAS